MAKMTTEEFIARAKEVHGDKYDYSKVQVNGVDNKVCIICPEHGEFWQTPYKHLKGQGCSKCYRVLISSVDDFIAKAKEVHGDKYDYSRVSFVNAGTKVCIICPEHGAFWQTPSQHLGGHGCKKCAMETLTKQKCLTTEEFITRAKQVHGDKYDYSKVQVNGVDNKVCIICPEHGEFWQRPSAHLRGQGCKKCMFDKMRDDRSLTTKDFVERARKVHGDKYDYSKVEYVNSSIKVCIICPEHGEFWMLPSNHLKGQTCPKCAGRNKQTTEEFIARAKQVHGDKYDYSKVNYKNASTKVCIICPEHGEFWQTPNGHLNGAGCGKCSGNRKLTVEEFIERARKVHGDKYDYSKVEYVNAQEKVCIICPEHGEFWQKANTHLRGGACPNCFHFTKQYKFNLLEEFESEYAFRAFLENNDINILLSILINIEPKYEPIKKDIERALAHASETNPIQSLREKYSSETGELDETDDDDELMYDIDTDDTVNSVVDWDDDDIVNEMISQESDTDNEEEDELSIDDIIRNDEDEIRVINRLDSEHLITPEVREYIKAKYKNDMMRAWMAKRDNK